MGNLTCTEVKGAVEGHIIHKGPSSCDPKSSAVFSTAEMVVGAGGNGVPPAPPLWITIMVANSSLDTRA